MAKKLHPPMQALLGDIYTYLKLTGETRTSFGLHAVGDGFFVRRVEQGKQPRIETIAKVEKYIRSKVKAVVK
jgi:hypothetical protein